MKANVIYFKQPTDHALRGVFDNDADGILRLEALGFVQVNEDGSPIKVEEIEEEQEDKVEDVEEDVEDEEPAEEVEEEVEEDKPKRKRKTKSKSSK